MALRYCVFSEGLKSKWQATSVTLMMELNWGGHTGMRIVQKTLGRSEGALYHSAMISSVDVGHCGTHATPLVCANVQ